MTSTFEADATHNSQKQVAAENEGEEKKGAKTGHLKAMAAGADGTVFVAFKHGKIERYLPHGKLLFSKVGALLGCVIQVCRRK